MTAIGRGVLDRSAGGMEQGEKEKGTQLILISDWWDSASSVAEINLAALMGVWKIAASFNTN